MSGISKDKPANELEKEEFEKIYDALEQLQNKLTQKEFCPVNIYKNEELKAISPFKINVHNEKGFTQLTEFETFNQTADEYYSSKEENVLEKIQQIEQKTKSKKYNKLENVLAEQNKKLDEFQRKVSLNKARGDLIYAYFNTIQELLETLTQARQKNISWNETAYT